MAALVLLWAVGPAWVWAQVVGPTTEPASPVPGDPWSSPEIVAPRMDARPLRRDVEPTAAPATGERAVRSPNATGWRTAAALGGVVGLILLLAWGYRAVASGGGRFSLSFRARRPGLIEVLSRTAISPRQSLCLVRIGPRLVLLGVSPDAVRALDVIQDADLAAQLVGQATQQRSDSSTAAFARCLEREARAYEPAADHVDETTVPEEQRLADLKQKLAGTIARLRAATVGP